MSDYIINGNTLSNIANAIRSKTGSTASMTPTQMPSQIEEIGMVNYSTDEQVIGTWVDGKPIYQRTIYNSNTFTIGSSAYIQESIADLSSIPIKDVISPILGYTPDWGGSQSQTIPLSISDVWADFFYYSSDGKVYFRGKRNSGSTTVKGIYATLRYTKTTD